nr:MAG TPA: distal tail protein [Caudoviricetes sp.]
MGFSFNGTTSQSMGIATRITTENRMPDLRNNTITMPGHEGVFDFGETIGERKIQISCFIPPGKSDEDFLSLKDDIIAWLNPDNGLCPLVLDKEPGRVYSARLNEGFSFDKAVRNSCTFNLTFLCPDPYAYAATDETYDIGSVGTHTVSRSLGNAYSLPVYSLKGVILSGTDTYITITTNDSELKIVGKLSTGETLVIDSAFMTAKVVDSNGDTLRNGLPLLSELNFPALDVGENTVTVAISGSTVTFTELQISARSRWR